MKTRSFIRIKYKQFVSWCKENNKPIIPYKDFEREYKNKNLKYDKN